MQRLSQLLACLLIASAAIADPIHAVSHGGYWHHDSNWIFPERIGTFTRVGIPQDVAGSPDAVGYYARGENETRITAAVDVYPRDSALSPVTLADAKTRFAIELGATVVSEEPFTVGESGHFSGTRVVFRAPAPAAGTTALYFVAAGDWRVGIRVPVPDSGAEWLPLLDAFAREQRWDTLVGR
jgi:hypothetical protein